MRVRHTSIALSTTRRRKPEMFDESINAYLEISRCQPGVRMYTAKTICCINSSFNEFKCTKIRGFSACTYGLQLRHLPAT